MHCTRCGQQLPAGANFCPACGAPVEEDATEPGTGDSDPQATTSSLEAGDLEQEEVEALPDLPPGTGMLVVVRGPNAGSRFLLDRDLTMVGRHPESHIFLDDVTVSRRHAEVVRRGGQLVLSDLGSLNGTYVNGDRVEEQRLATGDVLQVGRFKLLFVGSEDAGG